MNWKMLNEVVAYLYQAVMSYQQLKCYLVQFIVQTDAAEAFS